MTDPYVKPHHCHSEGETIALGIHLGKQLPPGSILCCFGDLGSGKTTLIKGLVEGATGLSRELVNSPTFTYLNIYQGKEVVYHFDLYRLHSAEEFLSMGFDEYLFADGICCIEWSERIAPLLTTTPYIQVLIKSLGLNEREFRIML